MSVQYDEVCAVWEHTTPKARKRQNGRVWNCDACRELIPVGHRYNRIASLFDGEWNTTVRCARCQAIYDHLLDRMDGGCCGECPDPELNCGHEYEEEWGEPPPPEIAALAFMTAEEAQATL